MAAAPRARAGLGHDRPAHRAGACACGAWRSRASRCARRPTCNSDLIEAARRSLRQHPGACSLKEAAAEHGPFDLIVEATGFSPLVFEAAEVLGKNGVLVLVSVTGGERTVEVPADVINQGFVLGNKVMVGTSTPRRRTSPAAATT